MDRRFPEYYPLEKDRLEALVKRACIAIDTNVLLGLYRSSAKTSDELLDLLEAAKAQLWLPYQVGFEYHENLESVVADVRAAHEGFEQKLDTAFDELRKLFGDFRHPFIREHVFGEIDALEKRLREELEKPAWSVEELNKRQQQIRQRVESLFDDEARVGSAFPESEMAAILQEGARRYPDEIPPGFKDKQKTGNPKRRYGDLIIWKELMRRAESNKCPVVFVSDDLKEDWWRRVSGQTFGPLPALKAEFTRETGQEFHLYSSEQFLKHGAPMFLNRAADAAALADAERAARADELVSSESELRRFLETYNNLFEDAPRDVGLQAYPPSNYLGAAAQASTLAAALQATKQTNLGREAWRQADMLRRLNYIGQSKQSPLASVLRDFRPESPDEKIVADARDNTRLPSPSGTRPGDGDAGAPKTSVDESP